MNRLNFGRIKANQELSSAVNTKWDRTHNWLKEARRSLVRKNYGRAMFCLDHIVSNGDESIETYELLTTLHINMGNRLEALQAIDEAISLSQDNTIINEYLIRGIFRLDLGFYLQAINDFQIFVESSPMSHKGQYLIGYANQQLGESLGAIKHFSFAIDINPSEKKYYVCRAEAYIKTREYSKALDDLVKVIEFDQVRANAFIRGNNNFDEIYYIKGKFESLNKSIQFHPDSVEDYFQRGKEYGEIGEHTQALADYEKAISLNPLFNRAYFDRAYSKIILGEFVGAIEDINKVVEMASGNHDVYALRAYAYMKLERFKNAIDDFKIAISINPRFLSDCRWRADAFDMIGHHERAKMLRQIVSWLEFKPLPEIKYQNGVDIYLEGYER